MTKPTTLNFGELLIELGNGATPEVFSAPCGLTSKGFNGTASTSDTTVPDCDDPDAPAWAERAVTTLSRDISGSGILATESLQIWDDWFSSGLDKNVQITFGNFVWTGPYILSNFSVQADLGSKIKVTIAMTSDGQIVRTAET